MAELNRPTFMVRPCFQQDLEQVQLIYGHHVTTGTGTFEYDPPSLTEMEARWSHIVSQGWPFIVASPTRDLTRVLGFAYAQQFRDREGYAKTFEDSVYVAPSSMGQGVGKGLLQDVLRQLQEEGVREVLGVIGDSANAASIKLHETLGFRRVGVMQNVGRKFNRWLDVVIMQRTLAQG